MLLSEILGVERDTDFGVEEYVLKFKVILDRRGVECLMFMLEGISGWRLADSITLCDIINLAPRRHHPPSPPLTDEQREQLKAIWTLGYRSLVKDKYGSVYAYEMKPYEKTQDMWLYEDGDSYLCCTKPTECLESLVSWSDPEPFDIGKALGVGE